MKATPVLLAAIICLICFAAPSGAEEDLGKRFAQGCKVELQTYCRDVKPGGGRILSCLHAHSDKLSDQCALVAKEAAEEAKLMTAAIHDVKENCSADFDQFCSDVEPGKGRLLKCLEANDENLSQQCKDALSEIVFRD